MHCRAHLIGASIWPENKVTPCCVWRGPTYSTIEEMRDDVDQKFKSGNIPKWCQNCTYKDGLNNYNAVGGLQLLDIRNDNICNLKCRSCGPYWSSRWASELNITPIRKFQRFSLESVDLSNVKTIYYCGGEPFLSDQHVEILTSMPNPSRIRLVYNTNCTTLYYKNQYIPDLWKPFKSVLINASIDAVGPAAEVVRSGTVWSEVDAVLATLQQLTKTMNLGLSVTPVVSALNIWWFGQWLEYFDSWSPQQVWPISSETGDNSLGVIPFHLRPAIIKMLEESKFGEKFKQPINALKTLDCTDRWEPFIKDQQKLDSRRNESWYEQLLTSPLWNQQG